MLNIDNTATSWHEFLVSLATEAKRDADATDVRFALHGVLNDLANVALAYANRLELERGNDLKQPAPAEHLVTASAGAAPSAGPASPSELPGWLLETLQSMGLRIEGLEARVAYLEENANKTTIAPSPPFSYDAIDVIDEDRSAWNTVDRARSALRGMIMREHRQRAASRQAILSRIASLALDPDKDGMVAAEIRQHQMRADELATIDAVAGVMLDEISAIDDLLTLREYNVRKGWPQ